MDKFPTHRLSRLPIVKHHQDEVRGRPFFSKSQEEYKGRLCDFLLIRDKSNEDVSKATRCLIHTPAIGSNANNWDSDVATLYHLDVWTSEEVDEVFPCNPHTAQKGAFKTVLKLRNSHHEESVKHATLISFGHRICRREVSWHGFQPHGEFVPPPGYWEWSELILSQHKQILEQAGVYESIFASLFVYDQGRNMIRALCEAWCPTTNTFLSSRGEISVSLWDLKVLGGLPIVGEFYDEVAPSLEEIIGLDESSRPVLPISCRYLFHAYHLIRMQEDHGSKRDEISTFTWVRFWFRGKSRYNDPYDSITIKGKRNSLHTPDGRFRHRLRTRKENEVFLDLEVVDIDRDEVFLAAFLSVWLCSFVFPNTRGDVIRPETFKVASLMAKGTRFSLAVPVLASIYNGLNQIATSVTGKCSVALPWHFVHAWMASYFGTHPESNKAPRIPKMCKYGGAFSHKSYSEVKSREIIQQLLGVDWQATRLVETCKTRLLDTSGNRLKLDDFEYLVSIRSSFLTLRRGNFHLVESYSPHRFARQFGYCQDIPGSLITDIRSASLRGLLRYWRCSMLRGPSCEMTTPKWSNINDNLFVTRKFFVWWQSQMGDYYCTSIPILKDSASADFKLASSNLRKEGLLKLVQPLVENSDLEAEDIDDVTMTQRLDMGQLEQSKGSPDVDENDALDVRDERHPRCEDLSDKLVEPTGSENDSDRCNPRRLGRDVTSSSKRRVTITNQPRVSSQRVVPPGTTCRGRLRLSLKRKHLELDHGEKTLIVPEEVVDSTDINVAPSKEMLKKGTEKSANDEIKNIMLDDEPSKSEDSVSDAGKVQNQAKQLFAKIGSTSSTKSSIKSASIDSPVKRVRGDGMAGNNPSNQASSQLPINRSFEQDTISVSTYHPGKYSSKIFEKAIEGIGHDFLLRLRDASFPQISKLYEDASTVYMGIESLHGDPSSLKRIVDSYVGEVKALLCLEKELEGRLSQKALERKKAEVAKQLECAKSSLTLKEQHYKAQVTKLQTLQDERAALEEKLHLIQKEELEAKTELEAQVIEVNKANDEIASFEKLVTELEATVSIADEDMENIEELRRALQTHRDSLAESWNNKS